jgi:hypothetical protein
LDFGFGFWLFQDLDKNKLTGRLFGYWRLIKYQSTSGTKVYRADQLYKSIIALFFAYGNYLRYRKNTNNLDRKHTSERW